MYSLSNNIYEHNAAEIAIQIKAYPITYTTNESLNNSTYFNNGDISRMSGQKLMKRRNKKKYLRNISDLNRSKNIDDVDI